LNALLFLNLRSMIQRIFLLFFLGGALFHINGCSAEKQPAKNWYKGNLHAHSYWSDGDEFPEMIMDWYKSNGYDFTVLSDHNTLAEGEKWITLSDRDYLQQGFQRYLDQYGENWVEHRTDSTGNTEVRLKTLLEYRPLFEKGEEFLIIQSEEVTTAFEDKPVHINATNIQEKITPEGGASTVEVIQNNINAILEQRQALGIPIMPHINHPNFQYGISLDDFLQLRDVRFFEVYNGHPQVNNYGDSTHLGTEQMWDLINSAYVEDGKPLIYGVATDDSHHYHQFNRKYSNAGRGWVMVLGDSLSAEGIIGAMEKGNFYASTGVVLKNIENNGDLLTVEIDSEPGVSYEIQYIGVDSKLKQAGVIEKINGTAATFRVTGEYLFVRVRVLSDKTNKNFYDETEYEKAWTQPLTLKID